MTHAACTILVRSARLALMLAASVACVQCPFALAETPAQPELDLPPRVDDTVFREALRVRGLSGWLESQAASEPVDEIAERIRERERLLTQAGVPGFAPAPSDRPQPQAVRRASEMLIELLVRHAAHPDRWRWQYELARDYLERTDPAAFANLLLYELPGRDRKTVGESSRQALEVLARLQLQIAEAWKSVEALDEGALVAVRDAGRLDMLEQMGAQCEWLVTWARLHQALTAPLEPARRADAFTQVLGELVQSGRLDLPPGREAEQATALLAAAIAERHLGMFDQADARARQIVALLGRIPDKAARDRLRHVALLAVLEQIRSVRDAGRHAAAMQAVEQARAWAAKSRADEPAALIAVSLLEATVVHAGQHAAQHAGPNTASSSRPDELAASRESPSAGNLAWFDCKPCLEVLIGTSQQSPEHRDLLYEILAPALADRPLTDDIPAFALQLAAGCAAHDAHRNSEYLSRLNHVLPVLRTRIETSQNQAATSTSGELLYLLGQALALVDAPLDAARFLTDLAEQQPDHVRAEDALRHAVALAGQELRRTGPAGIPASRQAFVRAARAFRQRFPTQPAVPELTYAVAAALENDSTWEEAAAEYALVPADHARALDAALGRLRCWRQALDTRTDQGSFAAPSPQSADNALAAAVAIRRQFLATTPSEEQTASPDAAQEAGGLEPCKRLQLRLSLAELLNHASLARHEEAWELVSSVEADDCPGLHGAALRQQILALRELKRLAEARSVLEQYLQTDPEQAGTVMVGLLQSMHDEVEALLERGADSAAAEIAAEAVQVGRSLLAWADDRPGRLRAADGLTIRLWLAVAMLHAGNAPEALAAFERLEQDARASLPADAAILIQLRLGKADSMRAAARFAEALALYAALLRALPEHSSLWWQALVGSLQCHAQLDDDPKSVIQAIRQQRFLAPDLGGPRWNRALTALERMLVTRAASRPAP